MIPASVLMNPTELSRLAGARFELNTSKSQACVAFWDAAGYLAG